MTSVWSISRFHRNIPRLSEVSIGHALICDALYLGLEKPSGSIRNVWCDEG